MRKVALAVAATLSATLALALPATAAGSAWEVVPSPNVGSGDNGLSDITAAADGEAWAVGSWWDGPSQITRTLIERWDGSTWSVATHPSPGSGYQRLHAVDSSGPNDVWAVGSVSPTRFASERSLAFHWNGTAWSEMALPVQPQWDAVQDVDVVSATDAWAVGNGYTGSFVLRWNGASWQEVNAPNVGWLNAVHVAGPDDAWIVGQQVLDGSEGGLYGTLAMHWDGAAWTVVDSPSTARDFTNLNDVISAADGSVWAVGSSNDSTRPSRPFVMRFDGTAWSVVDAPRFTGGILSSVLAVSATEVWVAGTASAGGVSARWDGGRWQQVPAVAGAGLAAVTAAPDGTMWAAGTGSLQSLPTSTLVVRLAG